jgi:hypothetical protein
VHSPGINKEKYLGTELARKRVTRLFASLSTQAKAAFGADCAIDIVRSLAAVWSRHQYMNWKVKTQLGTKAYFHAPEISRFTRAGNSIHCAARACKADLAWLAVRLF